MKLSAELRKEPVVCSFFVAAAFSLSWAVTEALAFSMTDHYSLAQIVSMRYAVHSAALVVVIAWLHSWSNLRTHHKRMHLFRGAFMFLMPASFIYGAPHVTASFYLAILWSAPLVAAVLAHVWLRERILPYMWLLICLAYAGALLILNPSIADAGINALYPVTGAISLAAYIAISRELRRERMIASLFYTGCGALVCMTPFAIAEWQPVHPADIPSIVGLGLCGLLTLWCLDAALQLAPIGIVAPLLYGVVLLDPVARYVLQDQRPSTAAVSGGALQVAAALLLIVAAKRSRPASA